MASYAHTTVVMGLDTWFMYYRTNDDSHHIGVKTAPIVRIGEEVSIPTESDWTDYGTVLSEGSGWDKRFEGAISPCAVVYKDGTYFLYYIGADGNRSTDGGPRHRALGVATSSDGINFTKYSGNPILTFLPYNNEEEGVFSAAVLVDDNNEVVIYYSALDAGSKSSTTVNSDVRRAVSTNGISFTDRGEVLSHDDSSVWGYGDELFPVGVLLQGTEPNDTWSVFYLAKGHGAYWDLGIAQGSNRDTIASSTQKVSGVSQARVGFDPISLSPGNVVVLAGNEILMASADSLNTFIPYIPPEPEPELEPEPEPTLEGASLEKLIPETPSIEELKPEGVWGEKPFTVKLEKLWQELQESEKGTLGGLFPERPEITPPELEATWGQRPFEATWAGGQQQTWASPEGQLSPPRPEYEPYYPVPLLPEGELSPFDRPILGEDFYSQLEALGNSLILSMSQTEGISSLLGG